MPTTANMGMVLPTEDASDGVWDTLLNAALTLMDAHDHTSGKGVRVPSAGININADLAFGTFAATGLRALDFTAVATSAVTGYLAAFFVNSADNELYWRTSGGTNVKFTNGTSLNSALLGGFTGDYGLGDEEASYSSSTKIYNFLQDADHRGKIDTADIRLFEPTVSITNAVKLKSPTSLAASYDWIFPTALPGSTSLLMLSSAGQVSTSLAPALTSLSTTGAVTVGTTLGVTGATTLSSTLSAGASTLASATVTGAATVGTTLGVTGATTLAAVTASGLITANGGVALGASDTITADTSTSYKFGSSVRNIPVAAALLGDGTEWGAKASGYITPTAANAEAYFPISFDVGMKIMSIAVPVQAANVNTLTLNLYSIDSAGTVVLLAGPDVSQTGGGTQADVLLLDPADITIETGKFYYAEVVASASDTNLHVRGCAVTYKND